MPSLIPKGSFVTWSENFVVQKIVKGMKRKFGEGPFEVLEIEQGHQRVYLRINLPTEDPSLRSLPETYFVLVPEPAAVPA